jgi:hypothetical protein
MNDWLRTGGTISDEELAERWSEVELESRPDEDAEWDEGVAGMRPFVTIACLEGEEVARMRYLAHYNPASVPGSDTSAETKAEAAEFVCSRTDATGRGVVVAGFSESGQAMVHDAEMRDGQLELVPVGTIPITASPPPKILRRLDPRRLKPRGTQSRASRGVATPRERRARSASAGGTRASPTSEGELDPPPAAGWRRWLRRLLGDGL